MDKEQFKKSVEKHVMHNDFWTRIAFKATIIRTIRLTLKYPKLAQEYLGELPKAVCENV